MTSDTDHLLTFLAAGREFEHDGHTWRIVEVQHGGTLVADRLTKAGDPPIDGEKRMWSLTQQRLFPFAALAGQSVAAQQQAFEKAKAEAKAKAATLAAGRLREVGPLSAADFLASSSSMTEAQAMADLRNRMDEASARPFVIYGDTLADDSPRMRKGKAINMVNVALGKKKP